VVTFFLRYCTKNETKQNPKQKETIKLKNQTASKTTKTTKRTKTQATTTKTTIKTTTKSTEHPNLVPILSLFASNGQLWVMTPNFPIGSLRSLLDDPEKRAKPKRRLKTEVYLSTLKERLLISLDIVQGLIYLHEKGICHLNLKSENILLTPSQALISDYFSPPALGLHSDFESSKDRPKTGFFFFFIFSYLSIFLFLFPFFFFFSFLFPFFSLFFPFFFFSLFFSSLPS